MDPENCPCNTGVVLPYDVCTWQRWWLVLRITVLTHELQALKVDLCDRKPFGSDLNDRATDTGGFTVC